MFQVRHKSLHLKLSQNAELGYLDFFYNIDRDEHCYSSLLFFHFIYFKLKIDTIDTSSESANVTDDEWRSSSLLGRFRVFDIACSFQFNESANKILLFCFEINSDRFISMITFNTVEFNVTVW